MESSTVNNETYNLGRRLIMCSLGETCGIVKLIPENASWKRSSLALDDVYDWECVILVRLVVLSS